MEYRAIFFDLDGTLAGLETHRIPDSAREALALARRRGVKVFLATGRHPEHFSWGILDRVEFDGFLTCNGQYCFSGDEVIFTKYLPEADIRRLLAQLAEAPYPVMFIRREDTFMNMVDDVSRGALDTLGMAQPGILDPATVDPGSFFTLLLPRGVDFDAHTLSVMPGARAVRWHPTFSDVIPADGGKDAGIDAVLARYHIPLDQSMAFGDAENDIAMLRHAGVGVAMGNSSQAAKAAADYVTDHVDADGVWNALRRFGVI